LLKKNKKLGKRYLVLEGTDLYCYKEKEKTNVIFMHVLSGVFIEKQIVEEVGSPLNFDASLSVKDIRRLS
jgi:hypothetical protein